MATHKRYRSKPPVTFTSPTLVQTLMDFAIANNPNWYMKVSSIAREDFALQYGTKTWNVSPTGNDKAIVVSYPRVDGRVKMYDLDAGEFFWTKVTKLTRARVSGRASERDYEYNAVVMDDLRCESEDIQQNIDWESLKELDRLQGLTPKLRRGEAYHYGHLGPMMGGERAKKLIALPKKVKAAGK